MSKSWLTPVALVLLVLVGASDAMFHELSFVKDQRESFLIESFGFGIGGFQNITTSAFTAELGASKRPNPAHFCFIIKVTAADNSQFIDESLKLSCSKPAKNDVVIPVSWDGKSADVRVVKQKPKGYSNLYFVNEDRTPVSFDLAVTQRSIGKNFLSIGELPLPMFYVVDAVVYLTLAGIWVFGVLRSAQRGVMVLHHLMTGMVFLKMMSVLTLSVDFHYRNITGHPGGWTFAFFIVNSIKGISLFGIIALIGTGWKFLKPFLTDQDKKIFLIVIPLQVIDNIALVVIDESIPGMEQWGAWKNLFRILDLICCGAIILPIVWSIKHLRDAAATSGKSLHNIHKLATFRNFYLLVVSYIYFTRICVYLFQASLPFGSVWLTDLMLESATVAFFVTTGFWFSPESENPLLKVYSSDEEVELNEFGEVQDLQAAVERKGMDQEILSQEIAVKQGKAAEARREASAQADV